MMSVRWLLGLVFAAFVACFAQAGEAKGHQHCVCGNGMCTHAAHTHVEIEWSAWTSTSSLPTTAGNWYLTEDVSLAETYEPVDGVRLCLNGHSVRPNDPTMLIVEIRDGVTLAVTDCGTTVHYFTDGDDDGCYETVSDSPTEGAIALTGGYITGCRHESARRTAVGIDAGGALEFYAGNIVGNCSYNVNFYQNGGAVNVGGDGARLTMYGGEIAGNSNYRGGAVNVNGGGKAVLAGGRLRRNKATWGGALYVEFQASAELNGTEIDGNTASGGGAVFTEGDSDRAFSSLTMTAGNIHHNEGDEGGGIMSYGNLTMDGGTICSNRLGAGVMVLQAEGVRLTLGGTARFFDNASDSGNSNLLLCNYVGRDMYPKVDFSTTVPLVGGGNFGLSIDPPLEPGEEYVFATDKAETDLQHFTVDDPLTCLRHEDGNLIIYRPSEINFFALKGDAKPVLVVSNAVVGGTFVFPEPPASMVRIGYDFTGWRVTFDEWYGEERYDVGDESPTLEVGKHDVYADWSLRITQQPHATNDYTVLVAATDALEYQWYRWNADWEGWDEVPCMATNCLTAGRNGQTYRCTITYDDGSKSIDTESVVWEEPDTLVEVRPVAGANATVEGVYTNEVAVVPVGGKYYVFYGEEVGVKFASNAGYLFPTTLDGEYPVFVATVDPTVVRSAAAYQPHTCHDMNLVVPIGDLETFYLVCSNSYSGYLTADLKVDHDIDLGLVQLTHPQICLNGHVLDLNGHAFLQTGISTYFYDCRHTVARYYEADENGLWHLVEAPSDTSHCLYGGVITGGAAGENPGIFDNGVSTIEFQDVNVVGNDAGSEAIVYSSCKTRFIGGALCGNRADLGVLYEAQEYDCWCRIGGGVRISDNVSTDEKITLRNLLVREGGTISFDPDVPLATSASIGVTAEYGPITENLPNDYSPYFKPDHDGDVIANRANNQLFLLGPAATVTFDANGGTDAPAAITSLRVGDVLSVPGPGTMTRTGYAFEGWMLNGELMSVGDEIKITDETMTLAADWTLVIAHQPTYANGYTVGVGTADEIGYQWYGAATASFADLVEGEDYMLYWGTSYDATDDALHQGYDYDLSVGFPASAAGGTFTFASDRDDLDQLVSGLRVTGTSGELTTYEWIVPKTDDPQFYCWSYSTVTLYRPCLSAMVPIEGQQGAQLTEGVVGEKYFCRLTYADGRKTIDTNEATWYETHAPVTVTAEAGTHAELVGVYTNGVELVEEDDRYVVTYSEVVVAVYRAEAGYVFPNGTTVLTNTVTAFDDPTVIPGGKGYLPHVHCLCGDGACAVPGHAHQDLTWRPWTATDALPTESGNWYLTDDVTLDEQATLGAVDVRLCLNGHTIRQGADPDDHQSIVQTDHANCRFALTDCADATTPGLLTEGAYGAVGVVSGVFELWRGTLAGNTSDKEGGAVRVVRGYGARFRMYGGTICGNSASTGGGVYVDAETHAELYGGAITNNVAGSVGGGIFCLSWVEPYAADVTIGGALVVTDNRAGETTDNLHCLRGDIALSADVPLADAARVGISYTGGDTTPVATQVFSKAFGTDCTARLFSDDPFAYVAYNEEQKHELRTRILAQPTPANGYTFVLYTNGLAAGAVAYQWQTNAVGTVALASDGYYVYVGQREGDVCTAYQGVENYCLNVEFYRGEVIFEFLGDIPDDLEWSYCTTNAIDATHVRVTFDSEYYGNSILTASSSFSVRFLSEVQVPVPLEGETTADLVSREEGLTTYCRATIGDRTRDSDEVTVEELDPAASVTTNGVTTLYATLEKAWADAIAYSGVDVLIKMLKDATIESTLAHDNHGYGGILTLDLNGYVLAYAGETDACVINQATGPGLDIIDTDTTRRTPRYFTCDATGLWTLTNEVTERVVRGGLITGGRAGAVSISWGSRTHVISNVNFVGNRSSKNGGAVLGTYGSLEISRSTFLGNVADMDGGAVYASVPCTMTDCRVAANVAKGAGGGSHLRRSGSFLRTDVVGNRAGTGGGVYLEFNAGPCFPAGVKILMADGSDKSVENIVKGDLVATFDHEGGTNSSAAVFYVYCGTRAAHVFTLSFASGATLDIAGHHDLLLETTRKYVTVSSDNARSYLGKRFYNYMIGGWDELTDVTQATDCDAHYSIYTRGHGNCVANGLLTVPDDKDCFFNVYELDENLKADAERLAADIATYGLADPADYPNVPLDDFVDGNIRYAFVAIGKGLTTQEEICFWNEYDYGPVVAKKAASVRKSMMTATKSVNATLIASPSEPYLQVGEGVVVTGNVSDAGADNVYLKSSSSPAGKVYNPVIDILDGATDVDVGVTLSSGAGIFGWTNAVNYATSFFSDNPTYTVSYTADGELALRAGIQVGGDAWATVDADGTCTIIGTGAMWNHADWTAGNPLAAQRLAISSVVVADGVTSVGSQLFHKFYAITNVSCAASVTAVGDHAFYRCGALKAMSFAGADAPTFGTNAYTMHAGISIKDGMPDVYAIPEITISGYTQNLYGRVSLTEGAWEKVTTDEQKRICRFFKIVLEK